MQTLKYAKKRLQPIIDKYNIDINKDEDFASIISMFDGQIDYQIWALKLIKENICSLSKVCDIKRWIDENHTELKNLIKKNIISYKNTKDIETLFVEMSGLDHLNEIKKAVRKFNTKQRMMFAQHLQLNDANGITALNNPEFKEWYSLLRLFNKLPKHRQEKLIKTSSAINENFNFLKEHIAQTFADGYLWDKEDLLRYMHLNANDCKILINEDNLVLLEVPSFNSVQKLCGSGRTSWCLTREEHFFNDYVLGKSAKQYIVFDFNKAESDDLSHIGFTVGEEGIIHAHSTSNRQLLDSYKYMDNLITIHDVLENLSIQELIYMDIQKPIYYQWNIESVKEFLRTRHSLEICSEDNNVLVIRVFLCNNDLSQLVDHTKIKVHPYQARLGDIYVIMDFNKPYNERDALQICFVNEDIYQLGYIRKVQNIFNRQYGMDSLPNLNINVEPILNPNKKIEMEFHRCIDRGDVVKALELLDSNPTMDINQQHLQYAPIFSVLCNEMVDVFDKLIQNPSFDWSVTDINGDTILTSLLFLYMYQSDKNTDEIYHHMITEILKNNLYDVNQTDINGNTIAMLSAFNPKANWILLEALKNPNVDINKQNEYGETTLQIAIKHNNTEAISLLLDTPGIVISDSERASIIQCLMQIAETTC